MNRAPEHDAVRAARNDPAHCPRPPAVDLATRNPSMEPVSANQPLSSVEAFAMALVEASSCLTTGLATAPDVTPLSTPREDEAAPG